MSSSEEYWKRRAVRRMYEAMEESEKASEIVSKFYLRASLYIEDQLDEIFEKFRKRYGLSAEEAARLISRMKNLEDLEELKQLLRNSPEDTAKTELLAELESAAYGARMRRLASLQVQIGTIIQTVYRQELEASDAFYASLAEDCYYKTVFDLQQQVGVGFSFAHADEKQIDAVLRTNWSGKHYSERIWNNTQQLAEKTQEEILLSLLTGKTEREVSESISRTFASGAAQSRRLIRTESNHISTEMNFQAYEEAEIAKYRYLATLDLKTSKVCRELDEKTFPVRDRQTGVNAPPMHPWCRSTTVAVIDDNTLEGLTRSARDPKTGKTTKVPRSMTYEEWYEKYVKDTPEAELREKMLKNKASDQKQYEKYQAIFGEDVPDSLAKFQKMKYNEPEKWETLKTEKQDRLNRMDFPEMGKLKGKLGNMETRLWYKSHDEKIPDRIDSSLPLRDQAEQAFNMRNEHRTQARELMADQNARAELDRKRPNPTFDQMLEHKQIKYGLSEEAAYEDIIRSSRTTNKKYDQIAGVKEG